jgi:hypothetical protein
MSSPVTVQPDAVSAIADELAAMSGQLAAELPACRAAASMLEDGLGDDVGRRAARTARAWADLTDLLVDACATSAQGLRSAVESYRLLDAGLAADLGAPTPSPRRGPR